MKSVMLEVCCSQVHLVLCILEGGGSCLFICRAKFFCVTLLGDNSKDFHVFHYNPASV